MLISIKEKLFNGKVLKVSKSVPLQSIADGSVNLMTEVAVLVADLGLKLKEENDKAAEPKIIKPTDNEVKQINRVNGHGA